MIGMKDEEDKLMESLLDILTIGADEKMVITEDAKNIIIQLADKWKDSGIVKQWRQQELPEWMKKATAEELCIQMLEKIVVAPTTLHMVASIKMLIPTIADKLKEVDANAGMARASDQ